MSYPSVGDFVTPRHISRVEKTLTKHIQWEAGAHYMPWFARLTSWGAYYCPTLMRVVFDMFIASARWVMTTGPATKSLDSMMETLIEKRKEKEAARLVQEPNSDNEEGDGAEPELSVQEHRQRFLNNIFEGFAQGSSACVQEAGILSAPSWGYRFEDVSYDKIQIWHGDKDRNAPIQMIRYMAKRLQHSDLHEYKGETHFTVAKRTDEIFEEFVSGEH